MRQGYNYCDKLCAGQPDFESRYELEFFLPTTSRTYTVQRCGTPIQPPMLFMSVV
jgi:hypothetical protein